MTPCSPPFPSFFSFPSNISLIIPNDDLPKRIHHPPLPLFFPPHPLPIPKHPLLNTPTHLPPRHPIPPIRPHAAPSTSRIPPRLAPAIGCGFGGEGLRGADVAAQEGAGVGVVPEGGPPGLEEGFVAVYVEEGGDGGGVDVCCEGEGGPGGFHGGGGEGVEVGGVGEEEGFGVGGVGVEGMVVAGGDVGEGRGGGLEVRGKGEGEVVEGGVGGLDGGEGGGGVVGDEGDVGGGVRHCLEEAGFVVQADAVFVALVRDRGHVVDGYVGG